MYKIGIQNNLSNYNKRKIEFNKPLNKDQRIIKNISMSKNASGWQNDFYNFVEDEDNFIYEDNLLKYDNDLVYYFEGLEILPNFSSSNYFVSYYKDTKLNYEMNRFYTSENIEEDNRYIFFQTNKFTNKTRVLFIKEKEKTVNPEFYYYHNLKKSNYTLTIEDYLNIENNLYSLNDLQLLQYMEKIKIDSNDKIKDFFLLNSVGYPLCTNCYQQNIIQINTEYFPIHKEVIVMIIYEDNYIAKRKVTLTEKERFKGYINLNNSDPVFSRPYKINNIFLHYLVTPILYKKDKSYIDINKLTLYPKYMSYYNVNNIRKNDNLIIDTKPMILNIQEDTVHTLETNMTTNDIYKLDAPDYIDYSFDTNKPGDIQIEISSDIKNYLIKLEQNTSNNNLYEIVPNNKNINIDDIYATVWGHFDRELFNQRLFSSSLIFSSNWNNYYQRNPSITSSVPYSSYTYNSLNAEVNAVGNLIPGQNINFSIKIKDKEELSNDINYEVLQHISLPSWAVPGTITCSKNFTYLEPDVIIFDKPLEFNEEVNISYQSFNSFLINKVDIQNNTVTIQTLDYIKSTYPSLKDMYILISFKDTIYFYKDNFNTQRVYSPSNKSFDVIIPFDYQINLIHNHKNILL